MNAVLTLYASNGDVTSSPEAGGAGGANGGEAGYEEVVQHQPLEADRRASSSSETNSGLTTNAI